MSSYEPARATRRDWIGLAVIALPCMVYAMDLTVLNLAIPVISAELRPSSSQLLWIIDIYGFLVAGFLVTMGTLGDRIGRRRLLLIGATAFAIASALAALARSAEMLILMRALLGIAGATLAPSTMSLIRNMFHHPGERRFAIGVWIASFSFGGVIGPLVGGLLIATAGWPAVFLVAIPVMLLVLLLGPRLLPEYRDPDAGRIDPASVLLSLVAVLATIAGLKRMAESGPDAIALTLSTAGALLAWAFFGRQRRIDYPLLDTTLFRRPAFVAALSAYALSSLAIMGVYLFVTQYLQLVLGFDPLTAGLITVPWAVGFIVGSLLAPALTHWLPAAVVLFAGLLLSAVGMGLQGGATLAGGVPLLIIGMVITSLAIAPVLTLCNERIITSAPPERAGAASALSETSAEFSGALGIAVLGSLGTAIYRSQLGQHLPVGLQPEQIDDALATLGGALRVAAELASAAVSGSGGRSDGGDGGGAVISAALTSASQAAFSSAFQAAALTCTLILGLSALLVVWIERRHGGAA